MNDRLDDVLELSVEVLREFGGDSPDHRMVRLAKWLVESLGGEGTLFPFSHGLSARRARSMATALLRGAETTEDEEKK